jgi:hypothetical protein
MIQQTDCIHPDAVRHAMLSGSLHPAKRRNLNLIHTVCEERANLGGKDFELKAIGEAVEARGGPKVKSLWNRQSVDYRKLIEAWQAYAGAPKLRELSKPGKSDSVTRHIPDPATRIVVEKLIAERRSLQSEVNILKAQTKFVIDRRPVIAPMPSPHTAEGALTLEISEGVRLNPLEREAIEHSISPEFWRAEGWKEEKNGRVVKDLGEGRVRTIFKPGYVTAVQKFLDSK